ncbi:uncharacterized protein LOC110032351 [Phalaenopsis equestris]|uniref:uncharacterized protein LOC110032351 n=1 Tax=Phalaenopsis equestris TaxID=78828 RepID=UPI0009E52D46|nr:uncharacterized protein LOC110032351 [Phalaenopsis equestris]XP_020591608.1 uncharacterized protein LOC110032351 [Phalaenopsis equestris]
MLSPVNSSDPSCSSYKVSGFRADERDSDQLPLQEADPVVRFGEARTSNFSIRDHVFALRNKSIGKSWPFPSQLLQLCLKHGIRDLLPPFEPPNSVRAHCLVSSVSEAEKVAISSSQVSEETAPLVDGEPSSTRTDHLCSTSDQNDLLRCSDKAEVGCLCEQDKYDHNLVNDVCEIGSSVTNLCDIEIISAPIGEPVLNKCRLIPETIQSEETSITSTASDIMASKVCPVCKAFSSSSNTTLNAHMDQCLSMESDATLAVDKLPKLKLKPRKKRLMEDIYATAPSCTLEDLDRRNGRTWATNLSVVASSPEVNLEPKKPKLPPLEPRNEETEGAVYVDSNGIKLRILSKFNDAPQVLSREDFRPRRNIKSVQEENIILIKKKKKITSTYSKKMRLKMRNKKLSSFSLFKNEVQAEPKVVPREESHQEDEGSPVQLSGEADQSLNCGSATLKNWPSSKRSDLPKKVGKKNFHKILEHPKPDTQKQMLETRKPASNVPSGSKIHFGKLYQSLEAKTVDCSSNPIQNKENQEKSPRTWPSEATSANVLLKLSKASGSSLSSPRSTSEAEFYVGRKEKSHTSPKTHKKRSADQTYLVPMKTKRVSTLGESNSSTIKFRKHRSLLTWTDRRIGEFSSDGNPRQHGSAKPSFPGQEEVTKQLLNPVGTQCQDIQTRNSEIQVDQNVNKDSLLEDADASCIIPTPLISKDQDFQLNMNRKMKLTMLIEEKEMPLPRKYLDKQDKAAPEKLEIGGVESQAKATSSACLTSHGDLRIDIPRANSPIALDASAPNQEPILVGCREPSISPASSASTISPNDHHSKASVLSTTHGKSGSPLPLMAAIEINRAIGIERNEKVELDSTVKKLQHPTDYHPCCCSWQSFMAGDMTPTKQKLPPNVHIRPSNSYYAHTPSLESPTESILTRAFSDVGSTSPSSGTPTQSSSNSILRLMGKDLMVVHNEDSAQLPKIQSPATDNSNAQALPSPLGFTSYSVVPNHDTFSFAACNQSPSMMGLQTHYCLPSFHQRNVNHGGACTRKEVIMIDDSDEAFAPRDASSHVPVSHPMFQRPYSYFPPHGQQLPKDNGIRLTNPTSHGGSVSAPHLARPFVFQSPAATHLNSPFYYPQSLR